MALIMSAMTIECVIYLLINSVGYITRFTRVHITQTANIHLHMHVNFDLSCHGSDVRKVRTIATSLSIATR